MARADLLHLCSDLVRDAVRISRDHVPRAQQPIPVKLGKITSLSVAFPEIAKRTFCGQSSRQPLRHRVLVDGFVEATIKDGEEIAHGRLGDLLRLFIGLVDVDMAAENKIVRSGFPTLIAGNFSVVTEGVFDLVGCLVDLSRRQMTLHAPFNGLGAPRRDPDRWMGLLQWARPDRAIFEMEELSLMTPDRLGPGGHDEVIGFFETAAGFLRIDSVPYVLGWNATHEAGDEPSVRKAVDHGVFFGDAHGMIAQGQDVAENADLDLFCLLAQRRGD